MLSLFFSRRVVSLLVSPPPSRIPSSLRRGCREFLPAKLPAKVATASFSSMAQHPAAKSEKLLPPFLSSSSSSSPLSHRVLAKHGYSTVAAPSLEEEIKSVKDKIASVEASIKKTEMGIDNAERKAEEATKDSDVSFWRGEIARLGKKDSALQEEKNKLLDEKKLLLERQEKQGIIILNSLNILLIALTNILNNNTKRVNYNSSSN